MKSSEVRQRFLDFFEKRGHAVIPSASLVPEGDSSTLFTTAGMQPLVPYLLGQTHPKGRKIVNIQKCLRTGDIEEVGDNTHLTFFEMLGRWHLGDLDKKEVIESTFEFLTKELGLKPERMYASIFAGNEDAPQDEESANAWKSLGVPFYFRDAKENWWSAGDNGPCGPDSELFYDVTNEGIGNLTPKEFQKADDEQKVVEIWNDVFMEYEKKDGKVVGKLSQKNVDTGAGFERLVAVLQGKSNVFGTDLFEPIVSKTRELASVRDEQSERVIADHVRATVFAIADGVETSNTDRGYVLRRLIRRAVRYADKLGMPLGTLPNVAQTVVDKYGGNYTAILQNSSIVLDKIKVEETAFRKTLTNGLRELRAFEGGNITGAQAFDLYQTYGFPVEMTKEIAEQKGVVVDIEGFREEFKKHQEKSRTATVGKFKGGLADHGEETTKLHTAHHLLLAALQKVLGSEVKQRGSNITPERLRIDFSFERKLTDEEKSDVETQVNEWIKAGLSVVRKEMPREEAEKIGAQMEFGQKYPDVVSVYFIQNNDGDVISIEFCGGPHVENTSGLGHFQIKKEEASSAGVRRIKAVLE